MTKIATQAELIEAVRARGWRVTSNIAELRLGDRVLLSILSKRSSVFPFEIGGWVTNDAVSVAYTVIFHPRKRRARSVPLVLSPNFEIDKEFASEEDIDEKCAEFIEFARIADVDAGVTKLLDKESNGLGAMPARHLSALAVTGAVDVLDGYNSAFEKGDRLGFVPYIQHEHIAAAFDFAKKRKSDPNWLPRSPKLRV